MAKYQVEDIRNIALCGHGSAGKTTLAITAYEKALEERRQADDPSGLGATLNNLGALYHAEGEHERRHPRPSVQGAEVDH